MNLPYLRILIGPFCVGWLLARPAPLAAYPTTFPPSQGDRPASPAGPATEGVSLGKGGLVSWELSAPQRGRYEVVLLYRAREKDCAQELRVNGIPRGVGFSRTGGAWTEYPLVLSLDQGNNHVGVAGIDGAIELGLLRYASPEGDVPRPCYEPAVVSPRSNRFLAGAKASGRFKLDCNGQQLHSVTIDGRTVVVARSPYPFQEDCLWLDLPGETLARLPAGRHSVEFIMEDGGRCGAELLLDADRTPAPLAIITFDVGHGKSTLLRLPDRSVALIDTGDATAAESVVIPGLRKLGLTRIDHFFITHYHEDHCGGKAALERRFPIGEFHDYHSYRSGDTFDLGGVAVTVLNAWDDGTDENTRSLALRMELRGFVYSDGADNYAVNQQRCLDHHPELVRADVYYGNHHFHGSLDPDFLRKVDPVLVLVSAQEAVYARGAFSQRYQQGVEAFLKAHNGRLRETLLTRELGTTVIRVFDQAHWTYGTLAPIDPDLL